MDYNEGVEAGVDVNVIRDDSEPVEQEPVQDGGFVFEEPKYIRNEQGFVQVPPEEGDELINLIEPGDIVNYMDVVEVEKTSGTPIIKLKFFGTDYIIDTSKGIFSALAREVKEIWMKEVEEAFDKYPDFPKPGVLFEDINSVLRDRAALGKLIELFTLRVNNEKCDYIIAPESRGFILGAYISSALGKPMLLARKPGKLPGEIVSYTYTTEYSKDTLEMQKIDLTNKNVWFIDDIFATGGTYEACRNLVEQNGGTLAGGTVVKSVLGKEPEEVYTVL